MSADQLKVAASRDELAPVHKGAVDGNLEFPVGDAYWASYFATRHCEIASYTDLGKLTGLLRLRALDFSYLPSANYYFVHEEGAYRGLASACSARTREPSQSSVLVVAKASPVTDWHELAGKRLGYINTYCTTSYFAPSILLARDGIALEAFFKAGPVAPWQGQIDAVVGGTIDATMVFEDVWLADPDNAKRTRIIARIDDLPTPVFLGRTGAGEAFNAELTKKLLGFNGAGPGALYAGFKPYQNERMARFFADLKSLPGAGKSPARG